MKLVINDPEFDRTIRELVAATGESEDISLKVAVQERLDRVTKRREREYCERIRDITDRVAAMPVLDDRSADEILGYNEHGLFD